MTWFITAAWEPDIAPITVRIKFDDSISSLFRFENSKFEAHAKS